MDLATVIGFFSAFGVIVVAIMMEGNISQIYDLNSFLIVFCGSAGIVMMKYSFSQFINAFEIAVKTIFHHTEKPQELINKIIEISDAARKGGMLTLESIRINNAFLKQGVQYLVDGIDPEIIEQTLYNGMLQSLERNQQSQQIFKGLGEIAPAMGMIGTLIGLVHMLSHMTNPASIGPGMAVAMLTTFYGAVLANMVAIPIAEKLEIKTWEEKNIKSMIIDAVMAIHQGQNPRIIRDLLKPYLPGNQELMPKLAGK